MGRGVLILSRERVIFEQGKSIFEVDMDDKEVFKKKRISVPVFGKKIEGDLSRK
jgi:hypothetical protein